MKLLTLHPDILLHFLNTQFSLQELFHLRSISRDVCHLIESRHCIGRRTTLKLFWTFDDIKRYSFDLYHLGLEDVPELKLKEIGSSRNDDLLLNGRKFCEATCDLLIRLLPRLVHLTIFFTHHQKCFPDYLILCHMFSKLSNQLTGLSLFGKFNHFRAVENDSASRKAMGEAINKFATLKHLDMCLENLFEYEFETYIGNQLMFDKKILTAKLDCVIPHLSHLTFCFKTSNFEQQIVAHLGPLCTSLRLHRVNLANNCALIERIRDNSIKLKHLRLTLNFSDPNRKNHLIQPLSYQNCFTQLCSLELIYYARKYVENYAGPDMQSLLHLLVPLKQLTAGLLEFTNCQEGFTQRGEIG